MSGRPPSYVTKSLLTNYIEKTDPTDEIGDTESFFVKNDTGNTKFGVGTTTPFSRLSLGDTSDTLENSKAAIAFTEDSNGDYATGMFLYKNQNNHGIKFSVNNLPNYATTDNFDIKNTNLNSINPNSLMILEKKKWFR